MLGKLFKYEIRSISKVGLLLVAIAGIITAIGAVYLVSPLFKSLIDPRGAKETSTVVFGSILGMLGILSYILMLFALTTGFSIYAGFRFYKSMYSDEGYLTHTLPVTPSQLLFVKIVTASVWVLIMYAVLTLSALFLVTLGVAEITHSDIPTLLKNVKSGIEFILDYISKDLKVAIAKSSVYWIIALIITPIANICILFGALTVGQCSWKNKGLMGIVSYIGIRVAMSVISGVANLAGNIVFAARSSADVEDEVAAMYALGLANSKYLVAMSITLVFAVGLTIVSNYIIKNRLNLE
ncbi:MAG: hypothetical protein IKS85_01450 [Lachnospiraceae bacterium]|nr:hypothetical protein [Lachnospiraceae bacterium]